MNENINFKIFSAIFKEGKELLYLTRKILFLLLSLLIFENFFDSLIAFYFSTKIYNEISFRNYFLKISTLNLKSFLNITFIGLSFPSFFFPSPFKIFSILSIFLFFKIYFFIYHQQFPEELNESKVFLKNNFLPFMLCNIIYLIFNIFQIINFTYPSEITTKFILRNYILHLISTYPNLLTVSAVNSLIFCSLNDVYFPHYDKKLSIFYFIKYLKPFFIFQFILTNLINILLIPFLFLSKSQNFSCRFLNFFLIVNIIFFFFPHIVVIENLKWKSACKRNFEVLKKNKKIILFYFSILFISNFFLKFIENFKRGEMLKFLYLLIDKSFHYYILATTFVFYKKFLNS